MVCLVLSFAVACGSADQKAHPRRVPPEVVMPQDLSRYPASSPQRALLLWFQAIQFKDLLAVKSLTSVREIQRVKWKTLRLAVNLVGASLRTPKLVSTRESGRTAAIRAFVHSPSTKTRDSATLIPETFYLEKLHGNWKIDDITYLLEESDAALAHDHQGQ
jgi:hypothetical protein